MAIRTVSRGRRDRTQVAPQVALFKSGNEIAALAAKQVNFHVMGYYPITPSTEISEELDAGLAAGEHTIRMIPADGEHSAAGICYGASVAGGRVLNATSSQGLLFSLEQLPVQSGTRFPMVLNLAMRTTSGPINIHVDHSDLYTALNVGWIVLTARDAQAVYDMNILAVRIGEHPAVRLPVIVAFDGFLTSHQRRRVTVFGDDTDVRDFVGPFHAPFDVLDPSHPITVGPLMGDQDTINVRYQSKLAMDAALQQLPPLFQEYEALTGRKYSLVENYRADDADAVVVMLTSAAEIAKDAVDRLRAEGLKVGLISPNVIRPFPADEFRHLLRGAKAVLIAERADSYGAQGGLLAHEVKSTLKDDPENRTLCLSRIFGLAGARFDAEDAIALFRQAIEAANTGKVAVPFDYYGVSPGDPNWHSAPPQLPTRFAASAPIKLADVQKDEKTGKLNVRVATPRDLTRAPVRVAPGHSACPGCGLFPSLNQFLKGIDGEVVLLFQTGCGIVVTTGYPYTSFRTSYVHNLFQNGAATLSGIIGMYESRRQRGEIPADDELTFVMVTGDGGMDIGMGSAIGAAVRGHPMIVLEYNNQGYMNTGHQLSYATPLGHRTATSHVGIGQAGKEFQNKENPQIMAAANVPYVFTSVEGLLGGRDLVRKAAKAQWYTRHGMFAYGQVLSACPPSWDHEERLGADVIEAAVNCLFFPIYEIEQGKTTITYDPEERGHRVPVSDWLTLMGKTQHLLRPEHADTLHALEGEIERRWARLKARHAHPLL